MDFEVKEWDEDGDLDAKGFEEEEVGYDEEGEWEQKDEAAEEAAAFNSDEHEVRERAMGDEDHVVEVGGDWLVWRRFAHVAGRDRW